MKRVVQFTGEFSTNPPLSIDEAAQVISEMKASLESSVSSLRKNLVESVCLMEVIEVEE